mmetsp:Transcript_94642/g.289516  ORF Transcript_94642/g.289516 Transcript_94642/m.289516 type:complete len:269 (+) Transcript_94642:4388-5194(+)
MPSPMSAAESKWSNCKGWYFTLNSHVSPHRCSPALLYAFWISSVNHPSSLDMRNTPDSSPARVREDSRREAAPTAASRRAAARVLRPLHSVRLTSGYNLGKFMQSSTGSRSASARIIYDPDETRGLFTCGSSCHAMFPALSTEAAAAISTWVHFSVLSPPNTIKFNSSDKSELTPSTWNVTRMGADPMSLALYGAAITPKVTTARPFDDVGSCDRVCTTAKLCSLPYSVRCVCTDLPPMPLPSSPRTRMTAENNSLWGAVLKWRSLVK